MTKNTLAFFNDLMLSKIFTSLITNFFERHNFYSYHTSTYNKAIQPRAELGFGHRGGAKLEMVEKKIHDLGGAKHM